jgi:hypothetical protein
MVASVGEGRLTAAGDVATLGADDHDRGRHLLEQIADRLGVADLRSPDDGGRRGHRTEHPSTRPAPHGSVERRSIMVVPPAVIMLVGMRERRASAP